MDRVAKLLGVGENEEFILTRDEEKITAVITLEGLRIVKEDKPKITSDSLHITKLTKTTTLDNGELLNKVLLGLYNIEKQPWQPKENEQYFYPAICHKQVKSATWDGCTDGYALKLLGMLYRTKEEAQDHFVEDFKKLTGEDLEKYYVEANDYKYVDYKKNSKLLFA